MEICPGGCLGQGNNPGVGKDRQTQGSAAGACPARASPAIQEEPLRTPRPLHLHPPRLPAPRGDPWLDQRGLSCLAAPQPEGWCVLRAFARNRMRPWSFPRPSHPLPASLLGNKRASGSWAPSAPGPTPTLALLMWNRVLGSARLLSALEEETGRDWDSARSLLYRVPGGGPATVPLHPVKGFASWNKGIRSWSRPEPQRRILLFFVCFVFRVGGRPGI